MTEQTVNTVGTARLHSKEVCSVFYKILGYLKANWLLCFYLFLSVSLISSFIGPLAFAKTTMGIIVGSLITTVGAVCIAVIPAYFIAGILADIVYVPSFLKKMVVVSAYVLAGMPSIILGVIGFLVFCIQLKLGWSMLSAMLTLVLLLYPTLVTAFAQVLIPLNNRYRLLAKSMGIGRIEFLFYLLPKMHIKEFTEVVILGWATSLGDTAAVMLTCGALVEFPESIMDSVRLINYHIYLLAMEVPGGMPEARSLSLMMVIFLFLLLFIPRLILFKNNKTSEG